MDVGDLWRSIRHRHDDAEDDGDGDEAHRFLVVAPTIASKPSTGLSVGVNGNMAFFTGEPATTHISSMTGGVRVSERRQVLSSARFSAFTRDDRWFLQGDNRLQWTSLDTYPLGSSAAGATENVKFDFLRLYETAYRSVAPRLFAGAGINVDVHSNVRPGDATTAWAQSSYVAYSRQHDFSTAGQTSAGANVGVLYDSRDNAINAGHGWLASSTYRAFVHGFLGGDSSWQEVAMDVRTYRPLTADRRRKLAFWMMGDFVASGAAPYFDLPATGSDGRSARGYAEGRYRGEHLMYGEVEYRETVTPTGLLGFVAFLNTTTVGSGETHERLFDTYAPGAGAGLRVLLNKRSGTNLCADYGWGKAGSRGFYLAIQEAF